MKITIVGGGPGGLYTALLTKKARPDWDVEGAMGICSDYIERYK